MSRVNEAKRKFQEHWLKRYGWLEEDLEQGLLWCTYCKKDRHCKSLFGTTGSKNFKTSALEEHAKSQAHREAIILMEQEKDGLERCTQKRNASVEASIEKIFKCAYFIAKDDMAFMKLANLLELMRECGVEDLPTMYNDNKTCASFVFHMSRAIELEIYARLKKSPWFEIMVDESTDISVTKNMILYATFMEGRRVCTCYLGIVVVKDSDAKSITERILEILEEWDLDVKKMMGFGSDGASVVVGTNTGVATRLKALNPYMTTLHCCAHRTNLCVQEVCKKPAIKTTCKFVDEIVNQVAGFFHRSAIRQDVFEKMQEALDCSHLRILGIAKTRWLSRNGAIARLCDVYEPLMEALRVQNDGKAIYLSLKNFKIVYILHFLGDILKFTSDLSREFQKEYVDVTTIASGCRGKVMEIEEDFLHVGIDLNGFQRDSKNYPIIPDYGNEKGYLAALRSSVKGNMYRIIEMARSIDGEDLDATILFQKAFAMP